MSRIAQVVPGLRRRDEDGTPRRRLLSRITLMAVGLVVASSGVAYAYLSTTGSGTYGLARAGALNAPTLSVASQTLTSATLTWTPPSNPTGTTWVMKETGSAVGSGTCSGSKPTPPCTVTGLSSSHTYHFKLTYTLDAWQKTSNTLQVTTTAPPSPSFVQNASSLTTTVMLTNTVTKGDALILVASVTKGAHHTVTAVSGGGVTWHLAQHSPTTTSTAAVPHTAIWYGFTSTGGSKTVTLTVTGTLNIADVSEWNHIKVFKTTVKAANKNPNKTSTVTTNTVTPAAAGELLIAGAGITTAGSTVNPNSPFAKLANRSRASGKEGFSAYYLDPNTTAIGATWHETTTSKKWSAAIAGFSSDPPPVVSTVTPTNGPKTGGTTVTITGEYFTSTSTVLFGSTPAASVTVTSANSLTAVSPPHAPGKVDVRVTNPTGTSPRTTNDTFTYTKGSTPTVTGLAPATGPTAGGTSVVISGSNFTPTATVTFGTAPATGVKVTGPTTVTAAAPPHAAGAVPVTVTTTAGTSTVSSAAEFTYLTGTTPPASPQRPTVTGVSPGKGPGTSIVTITGTNFATVTGVLFGTFPATTFSVSGTTITATVPTQPAGTTVVVTVWTAAGSSSPSAAAHFHYTGPASVTPPAGTPGGSTGTS
jgi:hypothetical protein